MFRRFKDMLIAQLSSAIKIVTESNSFFPKQDMRQKAKGKTSSKTFYEKSQQQPLQVPINYINVVSKFVSNLIKSMCLTRVKPTFVSGVTALGVV